MLRVEKNVPLILLNTLAIDASAEFFCQVDSIESLQEAIAYAKAHSLPVTVLGGGSNLVLPEKLPGLTIAMAIKGIDLVGEPGEARHISVGAGENWHQLVMHTLNKGWFGLENLALIPGLAGAAPIQNIGAYGVELKDRFLVLEAVNLHTGECESMTASDCEFGYRDSVFKGRLRDQFAIVGIQLCLSAVPDLQLSYPALSSALGVSRLDVSLKEGEITPQQVAEAVCRVRRSKLPDPAVLPNAGSFFKNPIVGKEQAAVLSARYSGLVTYPQPDGSVKLAAGQLIEQCGWKGYREGKVGVHSDQALVLVNEGGSATQLLALADRINQSVQDTYGVCLEIEPRIYR